MSEHKHIWNHDIQGKFWYCACGEEVSVKDIPAILAQLATVDQIRVAALDLLGELERFLWFQDNHLDERIEKAMNRLKKIAKER